MGKFLFDIFLYRRLNSINKYNQLSIVLFLTKLNQNQKKGDTNIENKISRIIEDMCYYRI